MRSQQSGLSFELVLVFISVVAMLVMAYTGITQPEHRNVSLLMFTLGLFGTLRQYTMWRRRAARRLQR